MAPDAVTIEVTGNADKLADLLRVLEPFGIRELVQSGMVAIGRGSRSITERTLRPVPIPRRRTAAVTDPPDVTRATNREGEPTVAEMFYDDDADLSPDPGQERRGASATAARATPTRCPCATPASTSASACSEGSKSRAKAEAEGLRVAHAGARPPRRPTSS